MTKIQSQFSLTEYKDFRNLELQYVKMANENAELKHKLYELETLYLATGNELTHLKQSMLKIQKQNQQQIQKHKQKEDKLLQGQRQIQSIIDEIKSMKKINNIDTERESEFQRFQRNQSLPKSQRNQSFSRNQGNQSFQKNNFSGSKRMFGNQQKDIQLTVQNVKSLCQEYMHLKSDYYQLLNQQEQKQRAWVQKQENFCNELSELQLDIQNLQAMHKELQFQNKKIMQQNINLQKQVQSYKAIAVDARNKINTVQTEPSQSSCYSDDKDFATDLLTFEKKSLQKILLKIKESLFNEDLRIIFQKIIEAYETMSEHYREKLQIEYDLSDLEIQYQKQKTLGDKEILMQLKKQIGNFRKQLLKQKQMLVEKQDILNICIEQLAEQNLHEGNLKKYSVNLQEKLRKQKQILERIDVKERNYFDFNKEGSNTIQFKHNTGEDEIVREIIKKDRQNMQKMLKQTRNMFRK